MVQKTTELVELLMKTSQTKIIFIVIICIVHVRIKRETWKIILAIDEAIEVLKKIIDLETVDLVSLCLKSSYFSFKGKIYEQTHGVAMGSPLSPLIANLNMEHFEKKALKSFPFTREEWKRYVDDIFAKWSHGLDKLNEFLSHINSLSQHIKFTIEIEKDNQLPFLDDLLTKKNGKLSHQVFRKQTHTDKYLHSNSHHHPKQKVGVIKTLATRASRISDPEHLEEELNHLYKVFINNGYHKNIIQKLIKESTSKSQKRKTLENPRISLPYIKGTTDKIARVLTKHSIMVAFTPPNTIKNMLDFAKDLIDPKNHKGVYSIPCSCGKVYIGETWISFGIRLKEHISDITRNRSEKSVLIEHACSSSHYICME